MEAFSEAWARAFCREIEEDDAYRTAGASWEGHVVLSMTGDPAAGGDGDRRRAVLLELSGGGCEGSRPAGEQELEDARIHISASAAAWRRVLDGELDPIMGLMRGVLELEKGSLAELIPHASGARVLLKVAGRLETRFPEGWLEGTGS